MTSHRRIALTEPRARAEAPATRVLLDNGLAVVTAPRDHLNQAYVALYFSVGSRNETLPQNGITHVLEHMLFRGTASFADATALNAAAEDFGGFLEGATYRDHLAFATGCHPSALGDAIAILGELVQSPRYRSMEVERAILREELLETLDANGHMVDLDNLAHHAVFADHGLGLPIEGRLENLETIDQKAIEEHRHRFLVGTNAVLAVAGPMNIEAVHKQARESFGSLPSGEALLVAMPPPPLCEPRIRFVRDAASQVDVRLSFRSVPVHDAEYPALVMLARILADGLSSRMHAELVDRRGVAYSLHAGLTTYSDCGLFDFEVSVAPDRAAEAVQAILGFAQAAGRFRFSQQELQRARRRYRYGMEFMADSPADLASWYGRSTLFAVEHELSVLGGRISRLSEGEIRRAARRFFRRQGLVVTAVGELARGELARLRRVVNAWGQ